MPKIFPFLDLKKLHASIDGDIRAAIEQVLAHGAFINGPDVREFESAWARYCDVAASAACSNGTSSLHAIFAVMGIGAGDEVILPSHTFIAAAESIVLAGARPVFVEVDPETLLISLDAVAAAITPRTRAIIPVHLYGNSVDMDPLNKLAAKHGIPVIEDAAQAHGALYKSRKAGSLATAGSFSFFPGKNLGAFGDAGAVTSSDAELIRKIRLYVNHGRDSKFEHETMGTNYRIDTLQAAILSAKLSHLDGWVTRRRAIARVYNDIFSREPLASIPIRPVKETVNSESAWHLYVIQVPNRDQLREEVTKRGVATGLHYPIPCHLQPSMQQFGKGRGSLPVTEAAVDNIVSLPMCPTMTESDAQEICEILKSILLSRKAGN